MTTLSLFTVYDSKAQVYQRPFAALSRGEALRIFADIANDVTHPIGQHPEDYFLFFVAEFCQGTAEIHLVANGKCSLGCAIDFVKPKV